MPLTTDAEVTYFIEQYEWPGRGIGYLDVHLLAAVADQLGLATHDP